MVVLSLLKRVQRTSIFVALWLVALFGSTAAHSQISALPGAQLTNRNAKPLFWADGILRLDQLKGYQRVGFNTVVVRLTWPPSEDGQIVAADLGPQRQFAEAAASLGLDIIYALPPSPFGQERSFSISGDAGPYRMLWANWVQNAINDLRDTPNLIGWMLPDDPRSLPFAGSSGFVRWLGNNYGSVEVLNNQWGSTFKSLEEVRLPAVRQIIAAWKGPGALPTAATDAQMRAWIAQSQNRTSGRNLAFHPAELAIAHYEWDAYRALLDFWAQTVRAADRQHLVLAGRLPDYAQLLSLPASVDISQPAISPNWAEKDIGSHNPQSVAVARRGGRFGVVAMLSTQLPGAPEDLVPRLVSSWCDAALAEGARGIAFDDWSQLVASPRLRLSIRNTLLRLQSPEYAALWGKIPQATTAVVLTPLADGYTWRPPPVISEGANALPALGTPEPNAPPPRGLFGFAEDLVPGEPSDLVYALRWGTLFGNVDFISPDELGGDYSTMTGGVLKRYNSVLLPQALSVPPQMAQELANYVGAGGTVVADLGLGAAQAGGQVLALSDALKTIFGVIPTQLQGLSFNLKGATPHPLLPTWSALATTQPENMTGGDGPQGAAFAGPTAFAELIPGTVPLALAFQMPQQFGARNQSDRSSASNRNARSNAETQPNVRYLRSWLTLRPFGAGNAIFAPFRMWNLWHPGYPGFDQFHGDLMARNAQLSQLNAESLVPAPAGIPPGTALYPQAINFPNAVVLINHNATTSVPYSKWSAAVAASSEDAANTVTEKELANQLDQLNAELAGITPQPSIVQTAGVEQFLWSNALCLFPVGASPAPTLGRHPPVADFAAVAGDSGFIVPPTSHPVILHAFVPPQEMRVLRLLPIRALNPSGGPLASRVREYSPRRIEMRVWPNAQSATPGDNDWRIAVGTDGTTRVTVFDMEGDGTYRIAPGSRHRVAITEVTSDGNKSTTATNNYILPATSDSTLAFEVKGKSLRIEISPLDAPELRTPSPTPTPTAGSTPAIVPDGPPADAPATPAITPDTESAGGAPSMISPPRESTPAPNDGNRFEKREQEEESKPGNDENDGTLFHKRYTPR